MSVEEKAVAKKMAEAIAFMCLKDYFQKPVFREKKVAPREYTDVMITDADGHKLIRCQACHVSMMEDVADGIYDFLVNIETDSYAKRLENAYHASLHWKKSHNSKKRKRKR